MSDEPVVGAPTRRVPWIPIGAALGVALLVAAGEALYLHARSETNHHALASERRSVTAVAARTTSYRTVRRYVGTLEPWLAAHIGPQLVSAYVDTVLVRPGAVVHRGDVLATLDCREVDAQNRTVALQARSIEANQVALTRQATRIAGLLDGGYVAQNDVDQREAQSDSQRALLSATRAQQAGTALVVRDCVLRAPFDGEISARAVDPGAFVRPGADIVTEIDRSILRVTADVPETDFDHVAPTTELRIHVLSTGLELNAVISRRSPAADPATRTVHVEIDVPDPERRLPVHTTAELRIDSSLTVPALEIPLIAADVHGTDANVMVVDRGIAHARALRILGEAAGSLFVRPTIPPGSLVITEGRSSVDDGSHVWAHVADSVSADASTPNAETEPRP